MNAQTVISLVQQALEILVLVSAPLLLTALAVGLLISVFQAATQINEMTLSFIPKLLAMFLVGLRAMVRTATAAMTPHAERLIAFAAGGSLLAIMIYGLVQEVTYIHALRLMLCCAVGLLAGGESALKREV